MTKVKKIKKVLRDYHDDFSWVTYDYTTGEERRGSLLGYLVGYGLFPIIFPIWLYFYWLRK